MAKIGSIAVTATSMGASVKSAAAQGSEPLAAFMARILRAGIHRMPVFKTVLNGAGTVTPSQYLRKPTSRLACVPIIRICHARCPLKGHI